MNKKPSALFLVLLLLALAVPAFAKTVTPLAVAPSTNSTYMGSYVFPSNTNAWTLTATNTLLFTNLNNPVFTNTAYATNVVISSTSINVVDYDEVDLVIRGVLTVTNTPCTLTLRWGRTWDGTNGTSTADIVQQVTLAYITPFLVSTNIKPAGAFGLWPASIEFTGTNILTNFAISAYGVKSSALR